MDRRGFPLPTRIAEIKAYAKVSFRDIAALSEQLGDAILEKMGKGPSLIMYLERGGMFPGRLLCDYFGIKQDRLCAVGASHYVRSERGTGVSGSSCRISSNLQRAATSWLLTTWPIPGRLSRRCWQR